MDKLASSFPLILVLQLISTSSHISLSMESMIPITTNITTPISLDGRDPGNVNVTELVPQPTEQGCQVNQMFLLIQQLQQLLQVL